MLSVMNWTIKHNYGMNICYLVFLYHTFAFSTLMLSVGRPEGHLACKKTEWWGPGVVICLERGADLHTAQLMPLPLTVSVSYTHLTLPTIYSV